MEGVERITKGEMEGKERGVSLPKLVQRQCQIILTAVLIHITQVNERIR